MKKRFTGFTLIELLVVFTLLALLLSIAVPRYLQIADGSRVKVRDQNMSTMRDALDKFKADQGRYPTELKELVSKQYLRQIPTDPVTGSSEWMPLEDPAGSYSGVYDIAPPVGAALDASNATDGDSSIPLPPGKPNAPEATGGRAP